jgi:hypothetical protein
MSADPAHERTFVFGRYAEAYERQQRLEREAERIARELSLANEQLAEVTESYEGTLSSTLAEIRVHTQRALEDELGTRVRE